MQPSHSSSAHRTVKAALACLLIFLTCLSAHPMDTPAAKNLQAWRDSVNTWRAQREAALASPQGWLTLVALAWIHPGDNTIGSAADNNIRIEKLPAHLGTLHLDGAGVTLIPVPAGYFARWLNGSFPKALLLNGQPAPTDGGRLADDEDRPALSFNTLTMFVIHRGDRTYLRVKDTQAQTLRDFHGLHWYAPDAHYRIRARWIPISPPEKIRIANIIGLVTEMDSPGVAEFSINGKTVRLHPVIEDPTQPELTFLFRDATSETTTYQAGRFLDADPPDHGFNKPGTILLDFNTAYNPPCAFTPFATCPLPPAQNRLTVAIPAGEKRYQ